MIFLDINKEETKKLLEEKADLLKTIAHPVRLCILTKLIYDGSCNVTNLQHCLDVPQSTVSQHLAKLRDNGILQKTRNGLEINYRIENEDIRKIIEVLLEINEKEC